MSLTAHMCIFGFIMNLKKFMLPVLFVIACLLYLLTTSLHTPVDSRSHLKYAQLKEISRYPPAQNEKEQNADLIGFKEKEIKTYEDEIRTTTSKGNNGNKASLEHNTVNMDADNRSHRSEVTHIEFLKVHKAASSTLQNVMMRFGLKRNLSFVIPTPVHYISKQRTYFSDLWPPLPKASSAFLNNADKDVSNKYDILCNHMFFNSKKVSRLLHNDSVYIASVREPFDQFLSAAFYYKFKWKYPYLAKLPNETFITDLIRNPHQNEATTMSESMTYNSMAYDFGLKFGTLKDAEKISQDMFDEFLKDTANIFHLVMVFERFDESLVLMKRYLNWTLADILYTKSNAFSLGVKNNMSQISEITANDSIIFKERNKFDNGLYEFFKIRLEKQTAEEDLFNEEVHHFKLILKDVQNFCIEKTADEADTTSDKPKNHTFSQEISANATEKINALEKEKPKEINQTKKLLEVINSTITDKEMTEMQESELRELANLHKTLKWPVKDLTTILPMLFYDKPKKRVEAEGLKSDKLISKSKWNKQFFVTSSDCELMALDELPLFGVVKKQHLKLLVRRMFGENFSVIEAVKYIFTFY